MRALLDALLTAIRPARCGFGCGYRTRHGGVMVAHYRDQHAGDRMDRCERSHW